MSKNNNNLKQKTKPKQQQNYQQNQQQYTAKSCHDNIGLDPIQSQSLQIQPIPRPQSYKSASDDSDWGDFTSAQKKQRNQVIVQQYGIHHQPTKQQKKPFQHRNDKNFTDDIVDSQEVSQLGSSQDQNLVPNSIKVQEEKVQKHSKNHSQIKKRSIFNLMLIGAASTGKTTYMQCFLRQYKQKNQQKVIKQHTQKIIQKKTQTLSSNLSLDFYVIDTPGYTHSTIDSYSKLVQQQIKNRIENTKKNRKNAMTQSAVYQKQERPVRDQRVHCCLFFFRGPRLHSDDWRLMEQLHDKSKGDCYTIEQISQLKKSIIAKANQKNIQWFDIQQYIRQKYPQQLPSITKGPFGDSPPFMIACSITQIQKDQSVRAGRQYKWGTCYINDQKHTQFNTLNRLLTKCLHTGFVKMIDVMQDVQKAKIQKKTNSSKIWKKVAVFGFGVLLIGLVAKKLGHHQNIKN